MKWWPSDAVAWWERAAGHPIGQAMSVTGVTATAFGSPSVPAKDAWRNAGLHSHLPLMQPPTPWRAPHCSISVCGYLHFLSCTHAGVMSSLYSPSEYSCPRS